jgi:hypothetical protein
MSVRVDLQGISADYFIDRGSALGVMTGQRALLEYQAAGFSSRMKRVFCLNSAYGLPIQGSSADFVPRGICFRVFGSSEFPNTFKKNKIHGCKHGKIITMQAQRSKVLYFLPIANIPSTS